MTDNNIRFNDARGAASTLQTAPPFAFSDVKMTVFPLQANLARINEFCRNYFSQTEDQAGKFVQFRPFLPFVYLIILDYGRMSAQAEQTGWISQREVAFGIPLLWMQPDANGKMSFRDFAFNTPFIFVDNELSLSTGREVYGWPKLLVELDPHVEHWIKDPHGARRVFEIRSRTAAEHSGDEMKAPFLSVTQTPLTGLLDFPPNLKSATQAAAAWPNAMVGLGRAMRDAGMALSEIACQRGQDMNMRDMLGLDGLRRALWPENPARLLTPKHWAQLGQELRGLFPKLYSNTINLKQFRDAEKPMVTCYEAITAAKMPITRLGGGGFLGTQNLLMGQIDGGYRVDVLNSATVPIVNHLGLVEAGRQDVDGAVVSSFSPVCPFWIQIDMVYDLGETIAMRTRHGGWRGTTNGAGGAGSTQTSTANRLADPRGERDQAKPGKDLHLIEASNPFNTARGASEALAGKFRLKDSRLRVLPLLADPEKMNQFVKNYMTVKNHMHVRAWGRYVYMVCSHLEHVTSDMLPGPARHSREVAFVVPVKMYDWHEDPEQQAGSSRDTGDGKSKYPYERQFKSANENWGREPHDPDARKWDNGAEHLIGTALIAPFNYSDDITSAITESEVFGVPTLRSEMESPPEGWAAEEHEKGILMTLRASVVGSLGTGAASERKILVEVRDRPTIEDWDTESWRPLTADWGERLAEDLMIKRVEAGQTMNEKDIESAQKCGFRWGRAMALRVLGGLNGIGTLGLKQFRDATKPDMACYQGIVSRGTVIEKLHSLTEIEKDLTVAINRYPTQPIKEILGLIPKRTVVKDGIVCDEFEPLRPFEIHADLISMEGKTLFERAESDEWELINLPGGPLGWRPATESDVDKVREDAGAIPANPKVSVVRYDPAAGRHRRMKPLLLDEDEQKALVSDLRENRARDMLMLWRGVELGTLADEQVLTDMDRKRIEDLHSFVRTREPMNTAGGDTPEPTQPAERVFELAGALEFISPATVLDAILSRRWGASAESFDAYEPTSSDFRVRRQTLGPELAQSLFPRPESQGDYWPRSVDAHLAAGMHNSMIEIAFPYQFDKFMDYASTWPELDGKIREIARQTLPEWFCISAFERKGLVDQYFTPENRAAFLNNIGNDERSNDLILMMPLIGFWPKRYKVDLDKGMQAFFDALKKEVPVGSEKADEITLACRDWRRITRALAEEATGAGLGATEFPDLNAHIEEHFFESLLTPSPGRFHVRLGLLAGRDDQPLNEITAWALAWEEMFYPPEERQRIEPSQDTASDGMETWDDDDDRWLNERND